MLCDASSLKITNSFTYEAVRSKKCNVIVSFNENYFGSDKPEYVYSSKKIVSNWVRIIFF